MDVAWLANVIALPFRWGFGPGAVARWTDEGQLFALSTGNLPVSKAAILLSASSGRSPCIRFRHRQALTVIMTARHGAG